MYLETILLFCGLQLAAVFADFITFQDQNQNQFQNTGGFGNGSFNNGGFTNAGLSNGFQPVIPFSFQTNQFFNKQVQQQGQSSGNSAASGNAAAQGLDTASSINQANHQADQFNTVSNSLSANTAEGTLGSSADGAAQAGGQVQYAKQILSNFGLQNSQIVGEFRRKRQLYGDYFPFPQSQANANSLGGGSALSGQVNTNNNAFSQTSPFAGTGFAAGNSYGQGQEVSIYQAANTNSASGYGGRGKRQINYGSFGGFGGYGFPQSTANANALGGGSANYGTVSTNNNALSQTNSIGAIGFAAGNSMGQGQGVNLFNAANTNAASGIFGRR